MIPMIVFITMALIGFIGLSTPSPLLTQEGMVTHKRKYLTWIVISIGVGAIASIAGLGLGRVL